MRWLWIALIIIALLGILNFFPESVNDYYRLRFYFILRTVFDSFLNFLPFSFGWIFLAGIISGIIKAIRKDQILKITWWLNSAGKLLALFYIFWGFNYKASEVKDLLSLEPQRVVLDESSLVSMIDELNSALDSASYPIFTEPFSEHEMSALKVELRQFLNSNSLSRAGNPRVIRMSGNILNSIGISGIYWPYSFEAYVEKSLLPAQLYFTATHELCHAYGYTSEAEANFIACAALIQSTNPEHRTIAQFEIISELFSRLKSINPRLYESKWEELPPAIVDEFSRRKIELEKHQNWFWNISSFSNDQFLKFQGQESGNNSYSEFLEYYISWKNQSIQL